MHLTAAIIGLGNIGQGYDYDCRDRTRILTHAQAFSFHPNFSLMGGVDPDPNARARFEKKFEKPAFSNLSGLYEYGKPDIVSICVPTKYHYQMFKNVVCRAPKAIICEKPLAATIAEGQEMVGLAREKKCLLLVNYIRRFEPGFLELSKRIKAQEIGKIYKGTLWYSKGILNNGSHFIDLLIYLFGKVRDVQLLNQGRKFEDSDPEPDFLLRFAEADIFCFAGKEECFSVKDLELVGTRGVIKYLGGGERILVYKTVSNPGFPGQKVIERSGVEIPNELFRYQHFVADALFKALAIEEPLKSNGTTALETLAEVEKIIRMSERTADDKK